MIRGIDVSVWQGDIDFEKVKADGIGFVVIRAGYGSSVSQRDKCFEQNYSCAKAAGLDVGATGTPMPTAQKVQNRRQKPTLRS